MTSTALETFMADLKSSILGPPRTRVDAREEDNSSSCSSVGQASAVHEEHGLTIFVVPDHARLPKTIEPPMSFASEFLCRFRSDGTKRHTTPAGGRDKKCRSVARLPSFPSFVASSPTTTGVSIRPLKTPMTTKMKASSRWEEYGNDSPDRQPSRPKRSKINIPVQLRTNDKVSHLHEKHLPPLLPLPAESPVRVEDDDEEEGHSYHPCLYEKANGCQSRSDRRMFYGTNKVMLPPHTDCYGKSINTEGRYQRNSVHSLPFGLQHLPYPERSSSSLQQELSPLQNLAMAAERGPPSSPVPVSPI